MNPRDVVFLIRGMQLNGHVFGQGRNSAATLAHRTYNQILFHYCNSAHGASRLLDVGDAAARGGPFSDAAAAARR